MLVHLKKLLASLQKKELSIVDLTGGVIEDTNEDCKLKINRRILAAGYEQEIFQLDVLADKKIIIGFQNKLASDLFFYTKTCERIQERLQGIPKNYYSYNDSQQRELRDLTTQYDSYNSQIVKKKAELGSRLVRDHMEIKIWHIEHETAQEVFLKQNDALLSRINLDKPEAKTEIQPRTSAITLPNNKVMAISPIDSFTNSKYRLELINVHSQSRTIASSAPMGYSVYKIDPLLLLSNNQVVAAYFYNFDSKMEDKNTYDLQYEIKFFDQQGKCQRKIPITPPQGYRKIQDIQITPLQNGSIGVVCKCFHETQFEYQYEFHLISTPQAPITRASLLLSDFPSLTVHNEKVLVYAEQNNFFVINLLTGELREMMEEHFGTIDELKFLSSTCLISMSQDKVLKMWDIETLSCLHTCENVTAKLFLPEGRLVIGSQKDLICFDSFLAYRSRPIQVEDLQPIFAALANDFTVQECRFCNIALGDEGAFQVAQMLRTNLHLLRVDLSGCAITDKGAKYLLAALKANPTVQVMQLDDNNISAPLMAALTARSKKHHARTITSPEIKSAEFAKKVEIPADLTCPITHLIMRDPVSTADGETYEREAISQWLEAHETSPVHNTKLDHQHLVPNNRIRSQIAAFLDKNPSLKESNELYFPKSLQEKCLTAIQEGHYDALEQLIKQEAHLLTKEWTKKPDLLLLASKHSLSLLKVMFKILGNHLLEYPEIQHNEDRGELLFLTAAENLNLEGATAVCTALDWTLADLEDQLFDAIKRNQPKIISVCLGLGVSLETVNAEGDTPFLAAKKTGTTQVLELFRAQGVHEKTSAAVETASLTVNAEKSLPCSDGVGSEYTVKENLTSSPGTPEITPLLLTALLQLISTQSTVIHQQQEALKQLQITQERQQEVLRQQTTALQDLLGHTIEEVAQPRSYEEWRTAAAEYLPQWQERAQALATNVSEAASVCIHLPSVSQMESLTQQSREILNLAIVKEKKSVPPQTSVNIAPHAAVFRSIAPTIPEQNQPQVIEVIPEEETSSCLP